ncbi:MAG: ankyrin repeat domain-containing protein [Alphaproteobacteria bacterium]|nr:ankyrin repeat domain-containing protein [Alphaproteobacteria bacterium]
MSNNGNGFKNFFPKPPPSQAEINAFVAAAEKGDNAAVTAFLNRHGTHHIDQKNSDGYIALCSAADKGLKTTVELLLSRGAQIDARDKYSWSPLHHAASSGHTAIVALLLAKGAQMEGLTKENFTPLMWAVRFGYTETANFLLEKGANFGAVGSSGQTLQLLSQGSAEMTELVKQWPEMVRRREEAARKAREQAVADAKEKEIKKIDDQRRGKLKNQRPKQPPFKKNGL